jgi:hypothetical protein
MATVSRESTPDVTDYGPAEDRGAISTAGPQANLGVRTTPEA